MDRDIQKNYRNECLQWHGLQIHPITIRTQSL